MRENGKRGVGYVVIVVIGYTDARKRDTAPAWNFICSVVRSVLLQPSVKTPGLFSGQEQERKRGTASR